ncbi:MAG: hypothetical protein ACXW2E_00765 [Nitrososphaeraceae archaeon]
MKQKEEVLVTRDSIEQMLQNENPEFVIHTIGRALVGIFKYQTEDEKRKNDTNIHNGIGFSGTDAKSGSLTAKFYLKHKTLLPWMIENWTKPTSHGHPRLTKYHKQLNIIALEKRARKQAEQLSLNIDE